MTNSETHEHVSSPSSQQFLDLVARHVRGAEASKTAASVLLLHAERNNVFADGGVDDFDSFVAALSGASGLFGQMADAAKADDSSRMESISSKFDDAGAKVDTTARALGVKACTG